MATVDVYKIKVDVSGDQNVRGLQKDIDSFENGINKAGKTIAGFAAAAGAAFTAIGVSAFRMADSVVDSANGLGVAVDRFYQIGLAAEQSGIAFDDTAKMLGKFAMAMDMAAKGSQDMQDDFAKVGISLDDLATLSDQDLFNKAVAGLADMGQGAEQTATSMKLFGKAARDLDFTTFQEELKKNGEESKEAARLLEVGAEAADSLERAFRQLQIIALRIFEPVIQGIANFDLRAKETQETIKILGAGMAAIGSAILIANIIKLVGAFKQLSLAARAVAVAQTAVVALTGPAGWALIAGATAAAATAYVALDAALGDAAESAEDLTTETKAQTEAEKEAQRQREIQAGTDALALQSAKDRVASSQQNLQISKEQLQENIKMIGVESTYANLVKANRQATVNADKEIQALEALINQELQKQSSTSEEQIQIYREQQQNIRDNITTTQELNQQYYEGVRALRLQTQQIQELKAWQEALAPSYLAIATSAEKQLLLEGKITQETFNRQVAYAESRIAQQQALDILQKELDLANSKAVIDQDEVERIEMQMELVRARYRAERNDIYRTYELQEALQDSAVAGAQAGMEAIRNSMTPFKLAQDAIASTWGHIGSAIDDMVENGKASFSDLAKSILKDLAKMILKAMVFKYIFEPMMGFFGLPIPGKANGGPVAGGQAYMVGERGPELFVPKGPGQIIPNNQLDTASAGTGVVNAPVTNNYITNNINALDSRSVAQVFAENRQTLLGTVEYARKETAYGV